MVAIQSYSKKRKKSTCVEQKKEIHIGLEQFDG